MPFVGPDFGAIRRLQAKAEERLSRIRYLLDGEDRTLDGVLRFLLIELRIALTTLLFILQQLRRAQRSHATGDTEWTFFRLFQNPFFIENGLVPSGKSPDPGSDGFDLPDDGYEEFDFSDAGFDQPDDGQDPGFQYGGLPPGNNGGVS